MQTTIVPGVSTWSQWQPDRNLYFNSWFVESGEGNFVVDPLEPDDALLARVAERGLAAVVVTNRDHERAAATFAARFKVPVVGPAADAPEMGGRVTRAVDDGDTVFGWRVVRFDGMKTAGEFALFRPSDRTAISGDAFWGVPAGALTLMADDKLSDPACGARTRKLLAFNPRHLLVGDGALVFDPPSTLVVMLRRAPALFRRINIDELFFARHAARLVLAYGRRRGRPIGAKNSAIVVKLAPGELVAVPLAHHEEELFVVWDGSPTLRVRPHLVLRRGDVINFPPMPRCTG